MFKHCKDQKLNYAEHFKQAFRYFWIIQKAALAVLIHSFLPCYFEQYASKKIISLADHFNNK